MKNGKINVGLIGLGNVGSNFAKFLLDRKIRSSFSSCLDNVELKSVAVRERLEDKVAPNPDRLRLERDFPGIKEIQYVGEDGAFKIIDDPEIDVVVELIGGEVPAFNYLSKAIEHNKHVVTANKSVISNYGGELFSEAKRKKVNIGINGAVCGALPITQLLSDYLAGNGVKSISGILNGTTNYILTLMLKGVDYGEALLKAQGRGFAESDPTFDVSGEDARQKLAILSSIAFQTVVLPENIYMEGIALNNTPLIRSEDMEYNLHEGFVIKLIGQVKKVEAGLEAKVCPMLVPINHPFAKVDYENNTVVIDVEHMGKQQFTGKGAGGEPTAYAVMKSLIDSVKILDGKKKINPVYPTRECLKVVGIGDHESSGYIRAVSLEEAGIFALKSSILSRQKISIDQMRDLRRGRVLGGILRSKGIDTPIDELSRPQVYKLIEGVEIPDVAYIDPTKERNVQAALIEMKTSNRIKDLVYIRDFNE